MRINFHVICVGAGGTGGNFLKEFGRFLSYFHDENKQVTLSIVDGDRIEQRNCARQPFILEDENEFKSVTMASAIVENFVLSENNIHSYTHYIDTVEDLKKIERVGTINYMQNLIVLVGAVDNHRARQVMHDYFYECKNIIYIDSANEYRVGEVVTAIRIEGKNITPPRAYYYRDILKDKSKAASEISCGEINIADPQHITTNLMAANICLSTVINIIHGQPMGGITYFDSLKLFSRFDIFQGKCPSLKQRKRGAV